MARNVEIKARISDMEKTRRLVVALADSDCEILDQTDTFFEVAWGRLKLREFGNAEAELIFYERPDSIGPSQSIYQRVPAPEPKVLRELLSAALGVRGSVKKRRLVYLIGRTRVHLDDVKDLGEFLELEVVLIPEESMESGEAEAQRLMGLLEIDRSTLIAEAYVDLLTPELGVT